MRGEPVAVSVRTLLAWFHFSHRGGSVVSAIDDALRICGVSTAPDYARAWIDDVVRLVPRGLRASSAPEPPARDPDTSGAEPPAAAPTALASASTSQEPPDAAFLPRDPVQRVGALPAANRPLVSVASSESLLGALTVMRLQDLAYLAIADREQRREYGVLTWSAVSRALIERGDPAHVRAVDCAIRVRICNHDEDLFEVARKVQQDGCVLVRGRDGRLRGPLGLPDLAEIFGEQLEPFVLAGEVERTLREAVEALLPEAVAAVLAERTTLGRNAPLGLGDCQAILQEPARWAELGLPVDRGQFIAELSNVRVIRNDLVHFNPDGVDAAGVKRLRAFAVALRALTATVLARRALRGSMSETTPSERHSAKVPA